MSSCCQCQASKVGVPSPRRTTEWMRVAIAGLIAAQSMIFSLAVNLSPPNGGERLTLHAALAASALIVFLLVGLPLFRTATGAIQQRRLVFEQLFLAGIFGAFAASLVSSFTGTGYVYYEIVAILLAIYTFGQILGDHCRSAAIGAAQSFGQEFNTCERVDSDGHLSRVPVSKVRAGDLIHIPAGEGVPVDGVVLEGTAFVNEASLTGEPFPVVKRAGDAVLAGSYSVDAVLRVRSTRGGGQRQLDGILERIAKARAHPSQIEREADRLVSWFLPMVFVIAAVTFIIWTLQAGWTAGLFNALSVILVACPCSMGLATPIGIWSALADLAQRGLIAGNSDLVERLATVDTVLFDKTGTLADEHLELMDFVVAPGIDRGTLLAEIAAVEASSNHPIARVFRPFLSDAIAQEVQVLPGSGILGRVGGAELQVGNASLLTQSTSLDAHLRGADPATHTLYILRDGSVAGVALLREQLREPARDVITDLEVAGISCAILTGDRPEAAAVHGLANLHAGLSPLEKTDRMREISRFALFVGDGVNDALAMTEAHASLCIAASSGAARAAAMGEVVDLRAIPYAIVRCRAAMRVIRQNLHFAAAYNLIGIGLAVSGVLHPVAAALLMLASSFTVSWRALRRPFVQPRLSAIPAPRSFVQPGTVPA